MRRLRDPLVAGAHVVIVRTVLRSDGRVLRPGAHGVIVQAGELFLVVRLPGGDSVMLSREEVLADAQGP